MSIEGRHILTTRAGNLNDEFEGVLIGHGAYIESFPTIEVLPRETNSKLDEILSNVNSYDGIFFTSANGVKYFFSRAAELGSEYNGKIFVSGDKTGIVLKKFGYDEYFAPQNNSVRDLINKLDESELEGKKFLLPKGNLGLSDLKDYLSKFSHVDEVIVYDTKCPLYEDGYILWMKDVIEDNGIDCISFFSPSCVENFYGLLGKVTLSNIDIAVIGNTTLNKAREFGLDVEIIPNKSTAEELAKSIVEFYNSKN